MADDGEVYVDRDFRFVEVMDRTGRGGPIKLASGYTLPGEFQFDHQIIPIKKRFRLRGPEAKFVFAHSQRTWVHTTEGEFVQRLAIVVPEDVDDATQSLIDELGPVCCDTSPIEVDLEVVESWDTAQVDPDRQVTAKQRVRQVKVPPAAMLQKETAGGRVSAGKE